VWQRAVYLLWLCPQWLAEAALNFVRWRHFHFDYTRETDAVGSVAIQLVITWMKIILAVFLFVVDASTALQVTRLTHCTEIMSYTLGALAHRVAITSGTHIITNGSSIAAPEEFLFFFPSYGKGKTNGPNGNADSKVGIFV
ncbi:Sulfonylurea receptor 2B-like protein, partial [Daphnia magna]